MPIEYTFNAETNTIHSYGKGTLTSLELRNHVQAIIENPRISDSFHELCDLNGVEDLCLSSFELRHLTKEEQKQSAIFSQCRLAIVTSNDLVFGMMRIYESVSNEAFNIRICRTRDEAKEWLSQS